MEKKSRYTVDIAYVRSWPIAEDISRVSFEEETRHLWNVLEDAKKEIKFTSRIATVNNLRQLTTIGCRTLYYSGHAYQSEERSALIFEDDNGGGHELKDEMLKTLISAGDGGESVKFVILPACSTKKMGQAFVDAGVPHVVATESDLIDDACPDFLFQIYTALLQNKTVQNAFDIAKSSVNAKYANDERKAGTGNKFILLPEDKTKTKHNVKIFGDIKNGSPVNIDRMEPQNVLKNTTEQMLYRCQIRCLKKVTKYFLQRGEKKATSSQRLGRIWHW